jgi:hypothetical protein
MAMMLDHFRFGVWREQGPQSQLLVAGKSGHPKGPKGEFTRCLEPTKDVCR